MPPIIPYNLKPPGIVRIIVPRNNFKITNTKGYAVSQKYSETLNNEMRLINVMTQKIADDIIKKSNGDLN